jgi:hypothetical protein
MAKGKFSQEETDGWVAKLRARRDVLATELREVSFLIEAAEKHIKPLSQKKLAALKKLHEEAIRDEVIQDGGGGY